MPRVFVFRSADASVTLDAVPLLGQGCDRKFALGCTYSAVRLEEVAKRKLPELDGHKKWRFDVREDG